MMMYQITLAKIHLVESLSFLNIFGAPVDRCPSGNFLGIPSWYYYLKGETSQVKSLIDNKDTPICTPVIEGIGDFWLIGLAVIEILLRIAMLAAVFYVFYAGIKYTNSRGNADKIETAKKTLVDAIAGFVITVIATAAVSFIAKSFS